MKHNCIDGYTLQSRIYQSNMDCDGDDYEIVNTFDCTSNSTFVSCDCSHDEQRQCAAVTDTQYIKQKNGECDTSKVTDHRTYIVHSNEIPKSFIDSNCFQRETNKKNAG
eukprot:81272_1